MPGVKMVAVEPKDSPILTEGHPGRAQDPGHRPELCLTILDRDVIDEVVDVEFDDRSASRASSQHQEGLLGRDVVGRRLGRPSRSRSAPRTPARRSSSIIPDTGERYLLHWRSSRICARTDVGFWARVREDLAAAKLRGTPPRGPGLEIALALPGPARHLGAPGRGTALWRRRLRFVARAGSQVTRWLTGIEIHPGCHDRPMVLHRPRHGRGGRRDGGGRR